MQIFSPIIPGGHDELPILSLVGTIDKEREATNTSNVTDVEEAREYRGWQLNNLSRLQHPYAGEVSKILSNNDLLSSNGLFEVRQELLKLADTIQDGIRKIVEGGSLVRAVEFVGEEQAVEEKRKAA